MEIYSVIIREAGPGLKTTKLTHSIPAPGKEYRLFIHRTTRPQRQKHLPKIKYVSIHTYTTDNIPHELFLLEIMSANLSFFSSRFFCFNPFSSTMKVYLVL